MTANLQFLLQSHYCMMDLRRSLLLLPTTSMQKIKPRTEFPAYLDAINDKLPENDELPFRARLLQINKVRVNAKHDGVKPDRTEVLGYLEVARQFLDQGTLEIFKMDFWSLSLVSLLDDGETRDLLKQCESSLSQAQYSDALVLARKAFFIEFEKAYDIKQFENAKNGDVNWLLSISCKAPTFARTADYIEKNVTCPFEYIVRDHAHIDSELSKLGIDNGTWWNIWRLTPEVYRHDKMDDWVVKNDLGLFNEDGLEHRAIYVFENTIDSIRRKQNFQKSLRWVRGDKDYVVKPKSSAPIFKKADRDSEVLQEFPNHIEKICTQYSTPGLKGDGTFWYVAEFFQNDEKGEYISGFIDQVDIDWE